MVSRWFPDVHVVIFIYYVDYKDNVVCFFPDSGRYV
jgi:hypothetical protein